MLDKIRMVLVGPSHPGNIGATARAMKTMGLSQLTLVAPSAPFPCAEATARAAGADDILLRANLTTTLAEALHECTCVIGTSARDRDLKWPELSAREVGVKVKQESAQGTVAIVFGRESTGLSNQELQLCHYRAVIPTHSQFSSLNLAAAVQVLAYELRLSSLREATVTVTPAAEPKASMQQMAQFYEHLHQALLAIDFLKPPQDKQMMGRLQRLFNRIRMTQNEMNILRGLLTAIQKQSTQARVR